MLPLHRDEQAYRIVDHAKNALPYSPKVDEWQLQKQGYKAHRGIQ